MEPGLRSLDPGLVCGEWDQDRLLPASSPVCLPRVNDHHRNLATSAWHLAQPTSHPNIHPGLTALVFLPTRN